MQLNGSLDSNADSHLTVLSTAYGKGTFTDYRKEDETVVVALSYATLYTARESLEEWNTDTTSAVAVADTTPLPFPWSTAATPPTIIEPNTAFKKGVTMELNHAYESLETMRKLNLELKCHERGIYRAIDYHQCTTCLLEQFPQQKQQAAEATPPQSSLFGNGRFPRLQKLAQDPNSFPRLQKLRSQKLAQAPRCLLCATPCCRTHSSATFRQESLTVCLSCEQVFSLDFVVDCLTDRDAVGECVERMVDLYDRAVLLLKYSSQYIPSVMEQLQGTKVRQNKVGLGSSSAGVVSGILGIAAAATIITPAGPPLLIASLLFGGSATAVQTGTEARNYYSDSNQLAGRILALHGMVNAILRVTSTLRDAMLRDHIRTDVYDEDYDKDQSSARALAVNALSRHKGKVLAAATATRFSAAGMETAASLGTTSRFLTRTGSNLLKTMRVARFAGGAMSAAVLVFEAQSLNTTIRDIRAGNPCEKAESLRKVEEELETLPTTESVEQECQNYIQAMVRRERQMSEESVIQLLMEHTGEAAVAAETIATEEPWGQEILAGDEPLVDMDVSVATRVSAEGSSPMSVSLLERIQIHKENDVMSASLLERIQLHKERDESR
jgi:hypothetical protein